MAKKILEANGATDIVTVGEASVPRKDAPKVRHAH